VWKIIARTIKHLSILFLLSEKEKTNSRKEHYLPNNNFNTDFN
jgi:hypothetical protein